MNDLVRPAKIVGACLLTGIGALAYALGSLALDRGIAELLSSGCCGLGLWLLVGAWTGRSIPARVSGFITWFLSNEPHSTPKAIPPAAAPNPTSNNPA